MEPDHGGCGEMKDGVRNGQQKEVQTSHETLWKLRWIS